MKILDVLGTPLTATNYDEFTHYCHHLVKGDGTWAVDLSNTQVVTMRRHETEFRETTSRFDFFLPDGMPLIWCLNRKGAHLRDRVYGPKFMRHYMIQSPAPYTHYLFGASQDTLDRLRETLISQQPALRIVGSHAGYFKPDEERSIIQEINSLSPDFIWVGLGTPKQQDWIYRNKSQIRRGILFAVGFAFDVNAGSKKDAPEWMQSRGLTWLFRILSEPRRLLRRYLKYNTLFLFYLAAETLRRNQRASCR
jgi:N-acetylglucosaminyldiphosphoundecaprenol N-acetyl-beta-D-mannosaminyltransferase